MSWVVVMGASSKIGAATALELAKDGHDVVIHYLRHELEAQNLKDSISALGQKTLLIRHRFDRENDTKSFCSQATDAVGAIDALVVASAAGVMQGIESLTEHHINFTFRTSAIPLVVASTALRPRSVVAISSMGASRVVDNYASVGIAKAAMEAAVRYLAVELAPHTRVNAISVGLVSTAGGARLLPQYESLEKKTLTDTPMRRLVSEVDVARATSFLIGANSSMITGAIIPLDGGYSLRW